MNASRSTPTPFALQRVLDRLRRTQAPRPRDFAIELSWPVGWRADNAAGTWRGEPLTAIPDSGVLLARPIQQAPPSRLEGSLHVVDGEIHVVLDAVRPAGEPAEGGGDELRALVSLTGRSGPYEGLRAFGTATGTLALDARGEVTTRWRLKGRLIA